MTILCPRHIFAYFCTVPKKSIRFKLGTICCLVVFIFSPFISSRLPALRIQYIAELFILSSFRGLFLKLFAFAKLTSVAGAAIGGNQFNLFGKFSNKFGTLTNKISLWEPVGLRLLICGESHRKDARIL